MKSLVAALSLAAIAGLAYPAAAQSPPPGSYLQTCRDVAVEGNTLTARCRRAGGGGYDQTALPDFGRCARGSIGNNNGQLQCNYTGGPPQRPPQYGGPPAYGAPPGPPPGRDEYRGAGEWRPEQRERCEGLRHRAEDLRARRDNAPPWERERLDRDFDAARGEFRRDCGDWRD